VSSPDTGGRGADLLVFGEPWGRWPSSSQALIAEALRRGRRALWVETPARFPSALSDLRRAARRFSPPPPPPGGLVRLVLPVPPLTGAAAPPLEALAASRVRRALAHAGLRPSSALVVLPTAAATAHRLGLPLRWYRADDFACWPGQPLDAIRRGEAILASAPVAAPAVHLLPNGAGRALLLPHGADPVPPPPPPRGPPTAAYAGLIDDRLDLELLAALLDAMPALHLELTGPVRVAVPFAAHPRVRMAPPVPAAEVPARLAAAHVLLLPYRRGPLGDSLAPLKLPLCLSLPRPVVATAIPGSIGAHYRGDGPDFVAGVRAALSSPLPSPIPQPSWGTQAARLLDWLDALPDAR
jgi:hypothetical protein